MTMTTIHRYCRCGGTIHVRARPAMAAADIAAMFDAFHTGDGHGRATREEAAAVRRREKAVVTHG